MMSTKEPCPQHFGGLISKHQVQGGKNCIFCELPSNVLFHMLRVISSPFFFVRPLLITSRKAVAYRIKASWNPSINILTCNVKKGGKINKNSISEKGHFHALTFHCYIGERTTYYQKTGSKGYCERIQKQLIYRYHTLFKLQMNEQLHTVFSNIKSE